MIRSHKRQQGVALLEALVGILIFSVGILAMIGLQAQEIGAQVVLGLRKLPEEGDAAVVHPGMEQVEVARHR